jgi:alkyl hydroperoxide reductase subunit AhpC
MVAPLSLAASFTVLAGRNRDVRRVLPAELQGLQSRPTDVRAAGGELVAVSADPVEKNRQQE